MKSFFVRAKGLEPSHREALDPKSSVSTNFTTPAVLLCVCLRTNSEHNTCKNWIANIIIFTNWQTKNWNFVTAYNYND